MSLSSESRIVRREGVPQAKLSEDTVVLLNVQRGNYYSLDQTGMRIWELLASETTVAELCQRLINEFDVEAANCISDTIRFCEQLRHENLIVCLDETSS